MSTIRVRRRSRFTTIHRDTINDDQLSFRARGVLVWLLDKPDDWSCSSEQIARSGGEGRDAIRSALAELESAGYLQRARVRGPSGRWVTETVVYERPEPVHHDGFPGVGEPGVGGPGVGFPGALTKTVTDGLLPNAVPPSGAPSPLPDSAPSGTVAFPETGASLSAEKPEVLAARELVTAYWEWVRSRTGKPPASVPFIGLVKMLAPLLAAGWAREDVSRVLASMFIAGRTLSRQSVEAELRRLRRGTVDADRESPSGVVRV